MSDPYAEGIERLRDAIERLNLEHTKDMRIIVERIATLETLPRSIDLLRTEFKEYQREQRETERERDKHPPKSESGSRTQIRVAEARGKWELWKVVIAGTLALITAVLSVYSAVKVAQITATKESK
jgi:hypothetical protein